MTDTTIGAVTDDTTTDEDQAAGTQTTKTYTQKEVDDMMARTKTAVLKKALKPYEDLGDPGELRTLREKAAKAEQEQAVKRGDFEKVLQDLATKKDLEIQKRDQMIAAYKVDTPLLEEASKYRAVKPEQVKALLKNNVRLNSEGDVEVVDTTGKVRYSDKGTALSVADLVQEFLNQNPHFVQPTPATTNTKSSHTNPGPQVLDPTKLDMNKAEDREKYKQYRKEHGIA